MNLLEGVIQDGTFTSDGVSISGLSSSHSGKITLGFRAEDAQISETQTDTALQSPVYSMELLGEATMVTMRVAGALVSVKAGKDYRIDIGEQVGVSIPASICHLFNTESGERIEDTQHV